MTLNQADLQAIWVTLKLATTTTLILLIIGIPLSWWMAHSRLRLKFLVESFVALPLILPPTVLGFYMLIALGPDGPIGELFGLIGIRSPAFSFTGLVIGSVFYSLPFVVQPLHNAFQAIGKRPLEVAATLRANPVDRFFSVVLPMTRSSFLTASVLGFAHTIGEFGVVLMIGGNIPGKTKVLSIAIYDHVEGLEYGHAHLLSGGLLLISFLLLVLVYSLNRRFRMVQL